MLYHGPGPQSYIVLSFISNRLYIKIIYNYSGIICRKHYQSLLLVENNDPGWISIVGIKNHDRIQLEVVFQLAVYSSLWREVSTLPNSVTWRQELKQRTKNMKECQLLTCSPWLPYFAFSYNPEPSPQGLYCPQWGGFSQMNRQFRYAPQTRPKENLMEAIIS